MAPALRFLKNDDHVHAVPSIRPPATTLKRRCSKGGAGRQIAVMAARTAIDADTR
jgi:hypothetical protein